MGQISNISWTDSTHNYWRGCTKVSAGCQHCYAETLMTTRLGGTWGPGGIRQRIKEFDAPLRWNEYPMVCDCGQYNDDSPDYVCERCRCTKRHRRRVFSLSLGDFWEGEPVSFQNGNPVGGIPIEWLTDALDVIRRTPNLRHIICTKRTENILPRLEQSLKWNENLGYSKELHAWTLDWVTGDKPPANVVLLTSVENQEQFNKRVPELLSVPAVCHGLSCEPLLGPLECLNENWYLTGHARRKDLSLTPAGHQPHIKWVIVGGESGPKARPCNIAWIRSIKDQCHAAAVPCFVKQLGSMSKVAGECSWPMHHPKGGDPSEWPDDLRVQEFPEVLR